MYPEIFELLDLWGIRDIPSTTQSFEEPTLDKCPNCKCVLELNNYLVENREDFIQVIAEIVFKQVNEKIAKCERCDSLMVAGTQKFGDPFDLLTPEDIIRGYSLPIDIKKAVSTDFQCQCGNQLHSNDPFATQEEWNDWCGIETNFLIDTFDLSGQEANEFVNYLMKYPMLGMSHTIGERIFNEIKSKSVKGIIPISSGTVYKRGRIRCLFDRKAPYIAEELWNPPAGIPRQGRYNPSGVATLYLAESEDVIISELAPNIAEDAIDVADFLILEPLTVWDISQQGISMFTSVPSMNFRNNLSHAYVLPNFLAQCISLTDINGILYDSTKNEGKNLCLFHFEEKKNIALTNIKESIPLPKRKKENSFKKNSNPFRKHDNIDFPF
nr:RES family NAD+ phosphorylase [Bacillus cereus]